MPEVVGVEARAEGGWAVRMPSLQREALGTSRRRARRLAVVIAATALNIQPERVTLKLVRPGTDVASRFDGLDAIERVLTD